MRPTVVTLLGVAGVGSLLVVGFGAGCVSGPGPAPAPPARMPASAPQAASAGPAAPATTVPSEPPTTVAKAPVPAAETEDYVLDVRVADAQGRPASGVRVQAVVRGGEIRTAETSMDGGARFVHLGANAYDARARAEAPDGRVTRWRTVSITGTHLEASLVLHPGALLSGEVVEAGTGSPVGGAVVSVEEGGTTDELSSTGEGPPFATVATNALGAFGPVAVPRDLVVTMFVRAPNHADLKRLVAIRNAGDVPRLRFEMAAGGVVVGVVRTPDGRPVAGAHVAGVFGFDKDFANTTALSPVPLTDNWYACAATADADGRYRIDRLPLGAPCAVFAWAEGWATSPPVEDLVIAQAHPPATADLVLRRLGRLDVLVRDPEDRAVAGARVGEIADGPYNWGGHISESPVPAGPAAGTYRIDGHFPGDLSLHVVAPGLAPTIANAEIVEGDAREITVRLARAVSIRGVVLDDRGLPVEGATVQAHPQEGYLMVLDDPDERQIVTGPDGKFEIPGLAAGPHEVWASTDGDESWSEATVVGAPAEGVVVRLVHVARSGQIRFRLRVPPGGPVPAEVSYDLGAFSWRGGEFNMEHLSAGPGRLRLFPDGYAALTLDYVVAPERTTDLGEFLLDEGVVLRGRVTDPSGKAVEGATVTLVLAHSMGDPHVSTDADGTFEIPHGERGANQISVGRNGFLRGEFTVPGEATTPGAALVLRRGGLLRARVVDAAGRPAPSVFLSITHSGGATAADDLPRSSFTDARGACEVRLPAGTYGVGVGDAAATEIVLAEGGTTDLTLRMR